MLLNGIVKGNIDAADAWNSAPKAQVLGNVHYTVIETAMGAQINGKLIHRAPLPQGPGAGKANPGRKVTPCFDWRSVPSTLCP